MNVLITGVAGLLGSRLADWIIENVPDAYVVGMDDLSGGYRENVNKKVHFWQMDLTEHPIENCFENHNFDYVFHFAAYAAEGLSPFMRGYNYQNNLISTARVVNNCIKYGVKRLVFTSSCAVYGHNNDLLDENVIPSPVDPYGIAKYACEMDIKAAGMQHELDWCIIRPHNVYGAKQNIWDRYRNVLGIWMRQHLDGEPMTIFGDGFQMRQFSYIDDCLEPLWNAAVEKEASKEIINLGGIVGYNMREANLILKEILGGGETVYLEERYEAKKSILEFKKSVDILGYRHKTDLHIGLRKMWDWVQKQPKRQIQSFDKYELDKGMYSFWKNK
jgi:UDP-glucose 4-epimerase